MLNINYGHNMELMKKCRRLEEYAIFIDKVRQYVGEERDREAAITSAVDECISEGILTDILVRQRAEVISMVLRSYMDEKYIRAMKKEGFEEGIEEGIEEGRKRGVELINELNLRLIRDERLEDLKRASRDTEFQRILLREYGLVDEYISEKSGGSGDGGNRQLSNS